MENKKEKQKINPSIRFTQNLLILQAVNQKFMADLNFLKANVPNAELVFVRDVTGQRVANDPKTQKEREKEMERYYRIKENFRLEISKLRMKYNLSWAYQKYLEDLAELPAEAKNASFQYSKEYLPKPLMPFGIENPDYSKEILAVLAITPDTRLEDVQKYWKEIKHYAGAWEKKLETKKSKSYLFPKLKRDLEVYDLKSQGKTNKEIIRTINEKYEGKSLGHQDVNMIIKRLRDRASAITRHKTVSS